MIGSWMQRVVPSICKSLKCRAKNTVAMSVARAHVKVGNLVWLRYGVHVPEGSSPQGIRKQQWMGREEGTKGCRFGAHALLTHMRSRSLPQTDTHMRAHAPLYVQASAFHGCVLMYLGSSRLIARGLQLLFDLQGGQEEGSRGGNAPEQSRVAVLADAQALLTCYGVGEHGGAVLPHAVVELCYTSSVRFLQPGLLLMVGDLFPLSLKDCALPFPSNSFSLRTPQRVYPRFTGPFSGSVNFCASSPAFSAHSSAPTALPPLFYLKIVCSCTVRAVYNLLQHCPRHGSSLPPRPVLQTPGTCGGIFLRWIFLLSCNRSIRQQLPSIPPLIEHEHPQALVASCHQGYDAGGGVLHRTCACRPKRVIGQFVQTCKTPPGG